MKAVLQPISAAMRRMVAASRPSRAMTSTVASAILRRRVSGSTGSIRPYEDLSYLRVAFQVPVRSRNIAQLEYAIDHRLELTVCQPGTDEIDRPLPMSGILHEVVHGVTMQRHALHHEGTQF